MRYAQLQYTRYRSSLLNDQVGCVCYKKRRVYCAIISSISMSFLTLILLSLLHSTAEAKKCGEYLKKDRIYFKFSERKWQLKTDSRDWLEGQINHVHIECDEDTCNEDSNDLFIRTLSVPTFQPLTTTHIEHAWSRLMQFGIFRTDSFFVLAPNPQKSPNAVLTKDRFYTLSVCAQNYAIIQNLSIRYKSIWSDLYPKQFISEIKKRLKLTRGGPFPHDPSILRKQEKQIRSLYETLGYQNTYVHIKPRYLDPHAKKVSVEVIIEEGYRALIGAPLVKLDAEIAYSEIVQALTPDYFFDFWPKFFNISGIGDYDRKALRERVQNYEMSLRKAEMSLRRSGWISARVRIIEEVIDGDYIRPRLSINRGPKVRLFFQGNESLSDTELVEQLTLFDNGTFDDFELQQSRKKLRQHYQSTAHYYAQIKVKRYNKTAKKDLSTVSNDSKTQVANLPQQMNQTKLNISLNKSTLNVNPNTKDIDEESVDDIVSIVFEIDEGPAVYISHFDIQGIHSLTTRQVKQVMTSKEVGKDGILKTFSASESVIQDVKIQRDLERINKYYINQGFSNMSFRCADTNRVRSNPWDDVGTHMYTKYSHLGQFELWSTLVNKYRCFKIIPDQPSIAKRRFLTIKIEINEGKRTTVDRVNLDNFMADMDDRMRDDLKDLLIGMNFLTSSGQVQKNIGLSQQKIELIKDVLLRHLRRSGYLKAQVIPMCTVKKSTFFTQNNQKKRSNLQESLKRKKNQTRQVCDLNELYGQAIDELTFDTQLGPKAEVEGIIIRGTLDSHPDLIHHDLLLKTGESLSPDSIFLSQTSLRNLGLFRSVRIESISLDSTQEDEIVEPVTLVVSVEENKPKLFDLALGLQLEDRQVTTVDHDFNLMYTFKSSIEHKNINGYGLGTGLALQHANLINTPLDIEGDKALWIVGPFLQHPRFLQTYWKFYADIAYEQHLSEQRDLYLKQYRGTAVFTYDFFYLNRMNPRKGLRLDITGEVKQEKNRILTILNERLRFRRPTYSSSLGIKMTQDRRDNPIHPTQGFYWSIGSEVLYSIQNQDDSSLNDSTDRNSFSLRSTLSTQAVFSWFKKKLIFAPTLRVGNLNTALQDINSLPADFSFKAGGDQVTYPVRGYLDASIDACQGRANLDPNYQGFCKNQNIFDKSDIAQENPQKIGGQTLINANLELRFPTLLIPNVWLALFNDWAAIGESWYHLSEQQFYASVGFGVRYLVLNQIPVRLDLAWPLKPTAFDYQQEMLYHFNIFYTF